MRKLLTALAVILFLLPVIMAAGYLALLHPPGPFESFQVRGASMLPIIRDGDLIINRPVNPLEVQVGDVITFEHALEHPLAPLITHRVIRIYIDRRDGSRVFVAQGDNAELEDRPITGDAIVGRLVFVVPRVGAVQQWVGGNLLPAAFFISAVFLLFWGGAAVMILLAAKLRAGPCKDEADMIEYYI